MTRYVSLLMVIMALSAPLIAQNNMPITVESKINAVTVFADRAMVKRSIEQSLDVGDIRIEVPHLPSGLLTESIRVSGANSAGAKISGVKVEESLADESSGERISDIEKQIAALEDRTAELNDRAGVLKQKAAFINSLSAKTSESIANDLPKERPSVAEWGGMLKFVDDGLESINQENRAIATELKDIALKHQMLDARLGEARGNSRTEKKAVIEVSIEKPGNFAFELSYMIMGASWSPYYDVRSWSDTNEIELVYMANVNQQTGEDWNNVRLELSTARPAAGANPPDLYSWYLGQQRPDEVYMTSPGMAKGRTSAQAPSPFNIAEPSMKQVMMQYSSADISQQAVSTTFSIRQRESIPSNSEFKKVPIKTISFSADDEYITVPRRAELVYLKSAIVNATDIPLLAGKANIFFDNNFVSSGSLPLVLPQENFNLYFGADEGIKVKRELVEKVKDDAGVIGKKERLSYSYKIILQNYHKKDSKITIVDQIPISQDDKIDVKLGDINPAPIYKEGDQQKGFLRWVVNLKPQQKTELTFKYQVKYPQEMAISGLE